MVQSNHNPDNHDHRDSFKFSYFNTVKSVKKLKDIYINEYLAIVSNPARESEAVKLRALPLADYRKAKLLQPCITGSGTTRSSRKIEIKNGLAVVDFDELPNSYTNWDEFKSDLESDPFTFITHFSLSGRGLCVFVKVPIENNFKETYFSLAEYYDFMNGAKIDFLADETRMRFISYDPEPYYNPKASIYTDTLQGEPKETEQRPGSTNDFDLLYKYSDEPATAFNNSGLVGLEIINEILTALGYTITDGKKPGIYEYQRPGGSLKSIVAFYNQDIVKFEVFSSNTGLLKQKYNLYDLYRELKGFSDYEASKELARLGFGKFIESSKNPFPIQVLPPIFRDYTINLNESVNYPIDYTATSLLVAIATAAGANFKVLVKAGWIERGSLFACLIGNAGANKTHPINAVFAPIKAIDKESHQEFEFQFEMYSSYEKLSKKDKELMESVLKPILKKSVLSNFTTEILFKRLSENERGCTVVSDELISFLEGMNNYSKSDQIGFYLSVWSNQSTTIDRVGSPIPLFIANPYLSIIGGLQPRALNKAFPVDKLNNGFYQRFLFAFPDSSLKQPINDNEANEELAEDYERFIKGLYEVDEPRTLTFSVEAKRFFYEWQSDNCDKVNQHQNSIKGEILSKFDNHFVRLALLVQIMSDPNSTEIEMVSVEASKLLCEYYLTCSSKVLAKIQNTESYLLTLPTAKQGFFNSLGAVFTTSEAVEVGEENGLNEKAVKRLLNDVLLFKKIKHGEYQKISVSNN
ncbi:DUF3987 domain-containing protein [Flavobacterium hibisci]|uniref:DUF3987 domain-containing protein n=1 Tax=Flavobacterium hibisci TaxID=1914462 RepID=UPI001CBB9D7D|nr:DUF3987 domain-containing protein [Flavobacterium hibisci]MBZ4044507.1 DUF3987 domain-containing protein [Flavobacterium hibisci]